MNLAAPADQRGTHVLRGDDTQRVGLDQVIDTMPASGADMSSKYQETSTGGLTVNCIEC